MPFAVAQLRRPPDPGRRRRHTAAWFVSVLLCGATVLFGAVALYAPMISLIQTVSGSPKK
jgi:hypothetical protein